jgi:hypothetical protein
MHGKVVWCNPSINVMDLATKPTANMSFHPFHETMNLPKVQRIAGLIVTEKGKAKRHAPFHAP